MDDESSRKRVMFTPEQKHELELWFQNNREPSREDLDTYAEHLGVARKSIEIWFKNARRRRQVDRVRTFTSSPEKYRGFDIPLTKDESKRLIDSYLRTLYQYHECYRRFVSKKPRNVNIPELPVNMLMEPSPPPSECDSSDEGDDDQADQPEAGGQLQEIQCDFYGCSAKLSSKASYLTHVKRLHLSRPIECYICKRRIGNSTLYAQHISKAHRAAAAFRCKFGDCNAAFESQTALDHHAESHTGELPFACEVCSLKFASCYELSRHTDKRHPRPHAAHADDNEVADEVPPHVYPYPYAYPHAYAYPPFQYMPFPPPPPPPPEHSLFTFGVPMPAPPT